MVPMSIAFAILLVFALATLATAAPSDEYVPNRYIVRYKDHIVKDETLHEVSLPSKRLLSYKQWR